MLDYSIELLMALSLCVAVREHSHIFLTACKLVNVNIHYIIIHSYICNIYMKQCPHGMLCSVVILPKADLALTYLTVLLFVLMY